MRSYVVFFLWFVSLSIMPSRSIHVVETGKIFFFFMGGYISALHFLYSVIDQWRLILFGSCKYCYKILKDDVVKVLRPICQQIWKIQQWPQDGRRSVFILISKKGNVEACSNYPTIVLISHASKVMLEILQARLQQYVNQEPDVQARFRKGRGIRDQIANIWESKGVLENHLLPLHWLH